MGSTGLPENMEAACARPSSPGPDAKLDEFEVVERDGGGSLGKGSFGVVRLIRHKGTDKVYALKSMQKADVIQSELTAQVEREIQVQRNMKHENVLRLYKHFEDQESVFLLLEFCAKGELYQLLRTRKGRRFSEDQSRHYFVQAVRGVNYLHSRGCVHRDLKPENLLVNHEDVLKVADFGWCALLVETRTTFCGTLDYLAPEMIQGRGHDHTLDNWSLGILLYEMLVGRPPFQSTNHALLISKILAKDMAFPDFVPPPVVALVCGLLQTDPRGRMSLDAVLQHPWAASHASWQAVHASGTSASAAAWLQDNGDCQRLCSDGSPRFPNEQNAQPEEQSEGHRTPRAHAGTFTAAASYSVLQKQNVSPPVAPVALLLNRSCEPPEQQQQQQQQQQRQQRSHSPRTLSAVVLSSGREAASAVLPSARERSFERPQRPSYTAISTTPVTAGQGATRRIWRVEAPKTPAMQQRGDSVEPAFRQVQHRVVAGGSALARGASAELGRAVSPRWPSPRFASPRRARAPSQAVAAGPASPPPPQGGAATTSEVAAALAKMVSSSNRTASPMPASPMPVVRTVVVEPSISVRCRTPTGNSYVARDLQPGSSARMHCASPSLPRDATKFPLPRPTTPHTPAARTRYCNSGGGPIFLRAGSSCSILSVGGSFVDSAEAQRRVSEVQTLPFAGRSGIGSVPPGTAERAWPLTPAAPSAAARSVSPTGCRVRHVLRTANSNRH